jgi:hypothetical protein
MRSNQPLHILLKSGEILSGPVTSSNGTVRVATSGGALIEASKTEIASVRGESEQAAYEKTLHPGLLQQWNGGTTLSFALTRGNSQTKNLALTFTADRETPHDKLALYANSIYSTNDVLGAIPSTTANAIQAGVLYDHDLTKRIFVFVTADFQTDALQSLNLRSGPGAGLGVHVMKTSALNKNL